MIPLAYETNHINEIFLVSFHLFDYVTSRLQYFRSSKSPPELHWWWKIFLSKRKFVSQFWSQGGRKPCFKMVSICVCGIYLSHVLVTDWDHTGAAFHAWGCPSVSVLPVSSHACPWDGGGRWSSAGSPVVPTELRRERNRFLKVSCFVLCLGFLSSPSFLHSLYDRKLLLFLRITFHAKEVLSLPFSKSLTFPVAWAGSLQILPDFES